MIADEVGQDWNYITLSDQHRPHLVPCGDGTYELILLKDAYSHPRVINVQIDGIDGYSTSDIIAEHPTRKGWWKIVGRADDQIVFANGEKVAVTTSATHQLMLPLDKSRTSGYFAFC